MKDSEVRKMTESLDRCSNFDATLSQQNTYNLFKHGKRGEFYNGIVFLLGPEGSIEL